MSDTEKKKPHTDTDTILMALDQIGQTIDVMTSVVGRLRTYLQEQQATSNQAEAKTEPAVNAAHSSRTVH